MVACGKSMLRLWKQSVPAAVVAISAVALWAGVAHASVGSIIQECNNYGSIDYRKHSAADLKNALGNLPADVDQYSDCRSLIQQALLKKLSEPTKDDPGKPSDPTRINEVTTASQRKEAASTASAAAARKLPAGDTVARVNGTEIERSGDRTLASSAAPGIPGALVAAIVGLMLLFGSDLAARLRGRSRGGTADAGGRNG